VFASDSFPGQVLLRTQRQASHGIKGYHYRQCDEAVDANVTRAVVLRGREPRTLDSDPIIPFQFDRFPIDPNPSCMRAHRCPVQNKLVLGTISPRSRGARAPAKSARLSTRISLTLPAGYENPGAWRRLRQSRREHSGRGPAGAGDGSRGYTSTDTEPNRDYVRHISSHPNEVSDKSRRAG